MTALHEQIRGDIETAILSGEMKPGDRLPVEHELMRRYSCSRMTVSKALSRLAAAGMIERRRRAGSFVASPRVHSMVLDIPDLAQEVAARGQTYSFRLLNRAEQDRRGGTNSMLEGATDWLELEGVHFADGRALGHEWRSISLTAVPEAREIDFAAEPPGGWLLGHVPWTEAETRIAAWHPSTAIAQQLGIESRTACLQIERRTWRGAEGITFVRQHFLGDSYDLVARFRPDHGATGSIRSHGGKKSLNPSP